MNFYGPFPTITTAYAQDGSGNEYFGEAPSGSDPSRARWSIVQKKNTGGVTNPTAWIFLFPIDPSTGVGSNAPAFVWANVTGYSYAYLGCSADGEG